MATHVWVITPFNKTTKNTLDSEKVRALLSLYLPPSHRFTRTPEGRPYAEALGKKCADFSLSHSKNLLVIGITDGGYIGVDVEFMKPRKKWQAIAKSYFTKREQKEDHFYYAWTAREAFAKALGHGILKVIRRISITYYASYLEIGLDSTFTHRIDFFRPSPEYLVALCREKLR